MLYTIIANGGLLSNDGKNVFNRRQIEDFFTDWSGGKELVNEDDEIVTIDDLIDISGYGESIDLFNQEMCEMGDDYVSVSISEINI